jgi:Flp pilus assembly protein TadG
MKLSHKSYFKSEWRVRARRILHLRGEKGSSLFELALILPVLSMLLVGIIMGGVTFYDYVTLAEAVAVGARSLATNAGTSTPCTTAETTLTNAATDLKTSAITISISFPSTNTHTDSCTGTIYGGDSAMVNATYPCNMTVPFTGINLCPVSGPISTTNSSGATTMSCPYTSCISSTTTVHLE